MGAVTVREVLWAVSGLLNDAAPQFNRWPESELVGWLDDAQMAVAKYLPTSASRIDAIKLTQGTKQGLIAIPAASIKPGDGSTPPATTYGIELLGAVRNMGADGLTPGRAITMVDSSLLDDQDRNWHTTTGAEVKHITHDPRIPRVFYTYPGVPPTGPAVWAEVQWVAQPVRIPNTGMPGSELYAWAGGDTTTLSLGDDCRDDLINYVCARARMKNSQSASEQAWAQMFASAFMNSLNAKVQAVTGNNPNLKRLPMAPGNVGTAS